MKLIYSSVAAILGVSVVLAGIAGQQARAGLAKSGSAPKARHAGSIRTSNPGLAQLLLSGGSRALFHPSDSARVRGIPFKAPSDFGASAKWSQIGATALLDSTAVKFGKAYLSPSQTVTQVYEGIGVADGTLVLDLNGAGDFVVTKLTTGTGDLDAAGQPAIKDTGVKVSGNRLKVSVFEGQSYFVEIKMPLDAAGKKSGEVLIENGAKSKLSLSGTVVDPQGTFAVNCQDSSPTVSYGGSKLVSFFSVLKGTANPQVTWKVVKNPANIGIKAYGSQKANQLDLNFQGGEIASGTYPVSIEFNWSGGSATSVVDLNVSVVPVWHDLNREYPEGTAYYVANSDGDYATAFIAKPGTKLDANKTYLVYAYLGSSGGGLFGGVWKNFSGYRGKHMKPNAAATACAVAGKDPWLRTNSAVNGTSFEFHDGIATWTKTGGSYYELK